MMLSVAAAEDIDLAKFSDGEIIALMKKVTEEVARRGIEKTATLPKGTYTAGVDLPAGKYIYTCLAKGNDWGNVTVYSDQGKGRQLLWNVVSAPEEGETPDTLYITLSEGDQLKSGVPFSLTVVAGVVFK